MDPPEVLSVGLRIFEDLAGIEGVLGRGPLKPPGVKDGQKSVSGEVKEDQKIAKALQIRKINKTVHLSILYNNQIK